MDVAIQEYAIQNGLQNLAADYKKVDEVPFDYHRRMVTVIANCKDELILITKGAPESVLQKCKYVEWNKEKIEVTPELTQEIAKNFNNYSEQGLRVLAVACRETAAKKQYSSDDETDLTLVGFLVFTDPPKLNASSAIAKLKALGVDTKILTGDNELVAKKVCEDLGLHINRIVTGSDLTPLSWVEFKSTAKEATIFARVTPDQKLDVIKALKENGYVVGYMGDGVNDAPALYEADAGISVDSAVDVSKSAADIVLLEKDLNVLANGVEEGRSVPSLSANAPNADSFHESAIQCLKSDSSNRQC